ncbi:pre-mRNA cleavage complex 2 protein Pcf11-like isoform X3 [Symsagittifera roscoffensis]|uniref:pre-mRNA cleavage complex 2 protein Pcf11-like isoform X3 n=1 Tax=Symsagittifera roscoffensis TaxID=84072 RepID=UPI00307B28FD
MPLDEDLEDYESTLGDLRTNSKPNINALTLLAEDYRNKDHSLAEGVVRLIETRLQRVVPTQKLPLMYLLDSIVKNVGEPYRQMFTENIVTTFCNTFERVDQTTRAKLYKLRTTWNPLFPHKMLGSIDSKIKAMDPSWPLDPQSSIKPPVAPPNVPAVAPGHTQAAGVGVGGGASSVPTSAAAPAATNIHINPRVYPHFPLANQLGANPAMYYGHPAAPISNANAGLMTQSSNQAESRDPRLRGKMSSAPTSTVQMSGLQTASKVSAPLLNATSMMPVPSTYPYAGQTLSSERTGDTNTAPPMFPYFAMPPVPASASQIAPSVAATVQVQMPGGGIVQLTPEQLKAAAAVAPIPGVEPSPVKLDEKNKTANAKGPAGAKTGRPGDQQPKKKFPKQQPKRPLSPWRVKRASPPNFMKDEKSSSDRERERSPERRRAGSEGKRKRPSGSGNSSSGEAKDPRGKSSDSFQRGRSSSPGPAKKKNNMGDSPKQNQEERDKSDEISIEYGSNVPVKKSKENSNSNSADEGLKSSTDTAVNAETEQGGGKAKSFVPNQRRTGRAQAEVAAKLLSKRTNNSNTNGAKNPRMSAPNAAHSKPKRTDEEGFIPIKNDVQTGKKDVDYRGIRGAASNPSNRGGATHNSQQQQSIRIAGMRRVGTGVPEVITPEQVYARAEMLLKSGKLSAKQCRELQEQIKEVQRRREKDTEKKASTDFDLRNSPGRLVRTPAVRPPMENQLRQWPGGNRGQNPSVGGRFGHPPRGPPLRGGEMRGFRQRPPQFMGNQRGPPSMGNQRPGMPPPPYRGGRMPDPRWRNIGPPRFGGERKDAPPPPNMSMRPPQFLPNRPPTAPMPPRPPEFPAPPGINQKELPRNLPPTEIYQFGPGYGYSPEWDRYYDQHGLTWPKEMPFDSRFAGAQVNRAIAPGKMPPNSGGGPMMPPNSMVGNPANQHMMRPGGLQGSILPTPSVNERLSFGGVSLDESNVDLSSLFNQLIDMGMISSSSTLADGNEDTTNAADSGQTATVDIAEEEEDESMKFKPPDADTEPLAQIEKISFEIESLKQYQFGVIQRMYRGLQCSSCGMRYPINKQSQYTAHLDWHFRQKKRKADGYVGSSREWFPLCEDWFVLSDHADRLSAGFGEESAARAMMQTSANDNVASSSESVEAEKMSVCADSKIPNDEICKICREYFEQFWHVTAEEWHFLDAIRVEGKTVHFFCYKEFTDGGNGPTNIPSTPRSISAESNNFASSDSKEAQSQKEPTREPNLHSPLAKEPPLSISTNSEEKEKANTSESAPSRNDKKDETAKPQHSLSSLNSILTSLAGDKEPGFSEIVAHVDDDDDVVKVKEEPKDFDEVANEVSSSQNPTTDSTASTSGQGKKPKGKEAPVLIRIKDEPMDETEVEMQVAQHRSR